MITPYVEIDEAQDYFDERLNTEAWDGATDEDKLKALKMATRKINNLNFVGVRHDLSQANEFPRGSDITVPDNIKFACCELALQLLDDVDPNLEVEELTVTHEGYAQARTQYDRSFTLPHIRAGIPSSEAWEYLVPYLVDPLRITLYRK
jgi:hypothetical protein